MARLTSRRQVLRNCTRHHLPANARPPLCRWYPRLNRIDDAVPGFHSQAEAARTGSKYSAGQSLQPADRGSLPSMDSALHLFHGKRHPSEMGAAEVDAFLSHLAVEGEVLRLHPESSAECHRVLIQTRTENRPRGLQPVHPSQATAQTPRCSPRRKSLGCSTPSIHPSGSWPLCSTVRACG
jgi:hypothetical protein